MEKTGRIKKIADSINDNPKTITLMVNFGLLFIHTVFIFFFAWLDAGIMFVYNLFSVAIYIASIFMIKYGRVAWYVVVVYAEIFIFMILGTISLGWNFGFQHYCYGFLVSTMFTDFFLGARKRMKKRTYILGIIVILMYAVLRIYTWYKPHIYKVDHPDIIQIFFIINAVITSIFIMIFIMIYASNAYRMERELNIRATRDMLTGLLNRRYMQEYLAKRLRQASEGDNIGIAIFDIDFFKKVNDNYGHDAGDLVLQSVAGMLTPSKTDMAVATPSRWGGEEFLIFFSAVRNISNEQFVNEITELCEEIRLNIGRVPIKYMDTEIPITVSAGVTGMREGMDVNSFFKEADDLLYYAKDHGRNRVVNRDSVSS